MRGTSRTQAARRLWVLALGLLFLSHPAAAAVQRDGVAGSEPLLVELDGHLAKRDAAAVASSLTRLDAETMTNERLAFDVIYVLLGRGQIAEARIRWNRLGARLQDGIRVPPRGENDPTADVIAKRRIAEASFVQGLLVARDGAKREALELLGRADGLGFPPLDSPLMLLAAECLLDLGEHAMAAQAYREILKHAPRNTVARLGLGIALLSSGDLAASESELAQVFREAPQTPHVRLWLGSVLLEARRSEEAKAHLEQEWSSDPQCALCAAKLAQVAYLGGDDDACASWLSKAMALDPTHEEANLVAGMLANRSGQYAVAIRHLSGVVARVPSSVRAQYQLAFAYRRSGDMERAKAHMEAYDRLIAAQKADSLGVRGSGDH
jgi:Flp pilus assembly protein TadD